MSTLKVNEITDTTGLLAPVFPAGSAQLNPLANREDKIINGDFGIWQRGTTSVLFGYGAADRWYNAGFGGTNTQSRQPLSPGDNLGTVGLNPTYFLRQTTSGQTLASQYAATEHHIEGVRSYAGQTITVLGWARRSSGTGNMAVEILQSFGTGGGGVSPSATGVGQTVTLGVTGTWAPFALTFAVPSIVGKTLGTDGNDYMNILFYSSAGSNFNTRTNSLGLQTIGVDLWGIHIRQGTWTAAATADYRPRDPGTELALCQRYFFGPNSLDMLARAYDAANGSRINLLWPTTMRAIPYLTLSTNTGGVVAVTATINTTLGVTFTCIRSGSEFIFGALTFSADAEL